MSYSDYFTNKSSGAALGSNLDFINAAVNTQFVKNSGETWIKIDTNVFDKVSRIVSSQTENDGRYAGKAMDNTYTGINTYTSDTKILDAEFKYVQHDLNTRHTIETIQDLNVSHAGYVAALTADTADVSKTLSVPTGKFTNIDVTDGTTTGTFKASGTSTLSTTVINGVTTINNTLSVNSFASKTTISAGTNLTIAGTSTLTGTVTCNRINSNENIYGKYIVANTQLQTPSIYNTVAGGSTSGHGNIGDSTHYWANVYSQNFVGTATSAKYADLAEKYSTDKVYEPGTVMEVNTSGDGELTEYKGGHYAGVISTNPAVMMNSEADGQYIALTGRVPVKAGADIKRGDYCIAENGKAIPAQILDPSNYVRLIGTALSDSVNGMVEIKLK